MMGWYQQTAWVDPGLWHVSDVAPTCRVQLAGPVCSDIIPDALECPTTRRPSKIYNRNIQHKIHKSDEVKSICDN
jgi:hypothetical protein